MFSEPFKHTGLSWQESEQWCNKHAGHLVSIESQKEQDFLNKLVRNGETKWIHMITNLSWLYQDEIYHQKIGC